MAESDLKAAFALYGYETMELGEHKLRVPRVLTRGQEKAYRAAMEAAHEAETELRGIAKEMTTAIAGLAEGETTEGIVLEIRRKAEAIEDTMCAAMAAAIDAMCIDTVPGLGDMSTESLSTLMTTMRRISTEGLTKELIRKFPTSAG